jgi:ABC-type transport system involved in multi-copper enzyme maturation permease subunit
MPRQFFAMVRVEMLKVYTRGSGIGALFVALAVPLLAVFVLHSLMGMQDSAQFNGQPLRGFLQFDVVSVGGKALYARNFFVLPLLLFLATAASVAGENADRTLRELMVRPVPRWSILAAKMIALWTLSAATLALTFAGAVGLGWAVFGGPAIHQSVAEGSESLARLVMGYAASFVSDMALIALGMALSSFVRSVGGVVASLILVLLVDKVVWLILKGLGFVLQEEWPKTAVKWTLSGAMGCWENWESTFEPGQFVAVVVIGAVATAIAVVRFARTDVP